MGTLDSSGSQQREVFVGGVLLFMLVLLLFRATMDRNAHIPFLFRATLHVINTRDREIEKEGWGGGGRGREREST